MVNHLSHVPVTPSKRGKGPRTRKAVQRLARRVEEARLEEARILHYEARRTDEATDIRPRYVHKARDEDGVVRT